MISNKAQRNTYLALSIMSAGVVVSRIIGVADGSDEWWHLVNSIIILASSIKFYLCYRYEVNKGNLFGKVNPIKRKR